MFESRFLLYKVAAILRLPYYYLVREADHRPGRGNDSVEHLSVCFLYLLLNEEIVVLPDQSDGPVVAGVSIFKGCHERNIAGILALPGKIQEASA